MLRSKHRRKALQWKPALTLLEERIPLSGFSGQMAQAASVPASIVVTKGATPSTTTLRTVTVEGVRLALVRVAGSVDYQSAFNLAASNNLRVQGQLGKLARLNTPGKYRAAIAAFGDAAASGAWAGASRDSSNSSSPLYWNNGGQVGAYAFLPGEPNNFKGKESKYALFKQGGQVGGIDVSPNQLFSLLVVEYKI